MLDISVVAYGANNNIIFNHKKSVCFRVGKDLFGGMSKLYLGLSALNWVSSCKYLGVMFIAGTMLTVDTSYMKRRFYASCNSLLNNFKSVDEVVKLHLVKSFCLPLLTYCIAALDMRKSDIKELAVCWIDAFRKNFHYHRWESVKDLHFYFGELPFEQLYDLLRWNFLSLVEHISMPTALLYDIVETQHRTVAMLKRTYGDIALPNRFKGAIYMGPNLVI